MLIKRDVEAGSWLYDVGGVFHVYSKGVKQTPYQAFNFQRQVLGRHGIIHNCEGIDVQDAVLDVLLGCHEVQMLVSTGGDGTLGKVTTSARKILRSQSDGSGSRSIDDILFFHNMAGTQNVIATYYGLPGFWQLNFAAAVDKFRTCGRDSLKVHKVPQFRVSSSYSREGVTYDTEDYGSMFIGASLNRFMREHYRVAKIIEPIPHSFADLGIISRGLFDHDYARSFLSPVKGAIYLDGKQLPIDGWNYLQVFSNDWKIDMKLTCLDPCRMLREFRGSSGDSDNLQIIVGTASMPKVVRAVGGYAFGLDADPAGFVYAIGRNLVIESEERQFNLEGDFHTCGDRVEIEAGYNFNLVGDHSREFLSRVFSGDIVLFDKFLDDFSNR